MSFGGYIGSKTIERGVFLKKFFVLIVAILIIIFIYNKSPLIVFSDRDNVFKGDFTSDYYKITKKLNSSSNFFIRNFEMNFTSRGEIDFIKFKLFSFSEEKNFNVTYRPKYKLYTISQINSLKKETDLPAQKLFKMLDIIDFSIIKDQSYKPYSIILASGLSSTNTVSTRMKNFFIEGKQITQIKEPNFYPKSYKLVIYKNNYSFANYIFK
jgi:hypothetical protein